MFETVTREEFDSLVSNVKVIASNIDNHFISAGWVFNFLQFLAAIVTIAGICFIWNEFRHKRINKNCQRQIIMDLIRHLFTNDSILETVYHKVPSLTEEPDGFTNLFPTPGLFQRFAILDSDLNLSKFNVNAKNFSELHKVSLLMRNYNIAAQTAEEHFADPACVNRLKVYDLQQMQNRGRVLIVKILDLAEVLGLKLKPEEIKSYISLRLEEYQLTTGCDSDLDLQASQERILADKSDPVKRAPIYKTLALDELFLKEIRHNMVSKRIEFFDFQKSWKNVK